jgi:hypothetical protein
MNCSPGKIAFSMAIILGTHIFKLKDPIEFFDQENTSVKLQKRFNWAGER